MKKKKKHLSTYHTGRFNNLAELRSYEQAVAGKYIKEIIQQVK